MDPKPYLQVRRLVSSRSDDRQSRGGTRPSPPTPCPSRSRSQPTGGGAREDRTRSFSEQRAPLGCERDRRSSRDHLYSPTLPVQVDAWVQAPPLSGRDQASRQLR